MVLFVPNQSFCFWKGMVLSCLS